MPGIEFIHLEDADYVTVRSTARCMIKGCTNGAGMIYKMSIKDPEKNTSALKYVSFCCVLEGHHPPEDVSWVGWTSLFDQHPEK